MNPQQKITPFLWFDGNAEEAVNYYTSIFKDSKIVSIDRYPVTSPGCRVRCSPRSSSSTVRSSWPSMAARVQAQRGHLDVCELRRSAGSGRVLGKAD